MATGVSSETCTRSKVAHSFLSLSSLFEECVHNVWTPLHLDARDRLAQQFDDALGRVLKELDPISFGSDFISFVKCIQSS